MSESKPVVAWFGRQKQELNVVTRELLGMTVSRAFVSIRLIKGQGTYSFVLNLQSLRQHLGSTLQHFPMGNLKATCVAQGNFQDILVNYCLIRPDIVQETVKIPVTSNQSASTMVYFSVSSTTSYTITNNITVRQEVSSL